MSSGENIVSEEMREVPVVQAKRLHETGHPFLTGAHTPMTEEKTLFDLQVTGSIPLGLEGRYLRIGPNPIVPNPVGYHWFTGDGMVHGLALKEGRALWYRNRWVRSTKVTEALGAPTTPGPRHGHSDNVNTNIVKIAGGTWALVESGSFPVKMSKMLDDQVYNPFDGTLKGSFTAHPHCDPVTGEFHAIAYEATIPNEIRHVVVSSEGKVIRELVIPVKAGPSIHDCALTARYAIVLDLPVTFSVKAKDGGHSFAYEWDAEHTARVGLLPRNGAAADIIWCDVEPCYVFHVANAYDRADGCVVLDVIAYQTMFASSLEGPDANSRFERWIIDPVARTVARNVVDASPQEFPRPDERRFGQSYRYAYTISMEPDTKTFSAANQIYKHDLDTGTRQSHQFGPGFYPGEFVFVPRTPESEEDDGWLLGLVVNLEGATTDLVIVDARNFESPPVASIRIPHRVPAGFHGNWLVD